MRRRGSAIDYGVRHPWHPRIGSWHPRITSGKAATSESHGRPRTRGEPAQDAVRPYPLRSGDGRMRRAEHEGPTAAGCRLGRHSRHGRPSSAFLDRDACIRSGGRSAHASSGSAPPLRRARWRRRRDHLPVESERPTEGHRALLGPGADTDTLGGGTGGATAALRRPRGGGRGLVSLPHRPITMNVTGLSKSIPDGLGLARMGPKSWLPSSKPSYDVRRSCRSQTKTAPEGRSNEAGND